MASLKTIPTVIIERNLDFNKLAITQIAENLVYNLFLIFFVISNFGIKSFAIAILARSFVGLILIYLIQPWSFGFAFNFKTSMVSKKVWDVYNFLISKFENEFNILLKISKENLIKEKVDDKLIELILKNRVGKIKVKPGFEGEYGEIESEEKQKSVF